jgi:hypothetical protein
MKTIIAVIITICTITLSYAWDPPRNLQASASVEGVLLESWDCPIDFVPFLESDYYYEDYTLYFRVIDDDEVFPYPDHGKNHKYGGGECMIQRDGCGFYFPHATEAYTLTRYKYKLWLNDTGYAPKDNEEPRGCAYVIVTAYYDPDDDSYASVDHIYYGLEETDEGAGSGGGGSDDNEQPPPGREPCGACTNGQVSCETCGGSGESGHYTTVVTCGECNGSGWDGADLWSLEGPPTIKCSNCHGSGLEAIEVIVICGSCSLGLIDCGSCGGSGWIGGGP